METERCFVALAAFILAFLSTCVIAGSEELSSIIQNKIVVEFKHGVINLPPDSTGVKLPADSSIITSKEVLALCERFNVDRIEQRRGTPADTAWVSIGGNVRDLTRSCRIIFKEDLSVEEIEAAVALFDALDEVEWACKVHRIIADIVKHDGWGKIKDMQRSAR